MSLALLPVPTIHVYGAMLLAAWGLGWGLARRRAPHMGVEVWHIDWLLPLLLISCGLGSRLVARLSQALTDGGGNDRVLYGGALLSLAAGMLYARTARIPLGRLGDAFAYSLPLGIAVLRVGCFFAGCCWGDMCVRPEALAVVEDRPWRRQVQTFPALCGEQWPLRVSYPRNTPPYYQHRAVGLLPPGAERSLPVHPVQLYEAAACLMLLGILAAADRRLRRWGESFLLFGLGYSSIRFLMEWFRADNPQAVFGLTVWQLASIGCAVACLLVWAGRVLLANRGWVELRRPGG